VTAESEDKPQKNTRSGMTGKGPGKGPGKASGMAPRKAEENAQNATVKCTGRKHCSILSQISGMISTDRRGNKTKDEQKVEEVMTSRGLSQENLRDMKALFDLFDIDGDGSISLTELETVMKTLGHCPPNTEEIRQMMIDFDEDGNEVIDFTEFTKMMKVHKEKTQSQPDAELRNALRIFDKGHSGTLTTENVQTILTQIGDEKVSVAEADEFLQYVQMQTNSTEITIDDLIKILMSS